MSKEKLKLLQGLYAITDEALTPDETVVDQSREALESGAKILQYRNKSAANHEIEGICNELQELCRQYEALFVLNDRVELAEKLSLQGLHVGAKDGTVEAARAALGSDGVLGVSCYGSLELARRAIEQGADYVAFGAFFPTPTKPEADVINWDILEQAKTSLNKPVCVIGGINKATISQIKPYEPHLYACVSAVFQGPSIKKQVNDLLEIIN